MHNDYFTVRDAFWRLPIRVFLVTVASILAYRSSQVMLPEVLGDLASDDYVFYLFNRYFAAIMFLGPIYTVIGIVDGIITRYEVEDEYVSYISLFRRKKFTFNDIRYVEMSVWPSKNSRLALLCIHFHGERRWLTMSVKSSNFDLFINCLKVRNVYGADTL